MELEQYNFSVEENQENSLKDLLVKYLFHWKWFVLSIVVSLIIGRFYYKRQTPLYEVSATILIKDDSKGQLSELNAFEDLGLFKKHNNIDNEIEILKSRSLMLQVVQKLNLNITYYEKERYHEREHYKTSPIQLNFLTNDSNVQNIRASYYIVFEDKISFSLKNEDREEIGKYKVGNTINTPIAKFNISATQKFDDWYINKELRVTIVPPIEVADYYRAIVQVNPVNKSSSVLMLTLQDPVIEKAKDIINNLIRQHNEEAISDKNQISKNTANFINDRIQFISNELADVETDVEDFKTKHKLTDVESEAKIFLQTSSESEMGLLEVSTQSRIADFLYDYILKHNEPENLIPINLGLSDQSSIAQINEYNKLVLDRNRILKNSSLKNPVVENINNQLSGLRTSIIESLDNYRATTKIKLAELNKKDNEIS